MKLSNMGNVNMLLDQRRKLLDQLDAVQKSENRDGSLGVTIRGTYQDWELVRRVKPVVIDALYESIDKIDEQLRKLGMEIDE